MPRGPEPWYRPRPRQHLVADNPYAPEGRTPPPPPPPSRPGRFGTRPVIVTAVVVLLLGACGGLYAATDGWSGRPSRPVAEPAPTPSGTPSAGRSPTPPTPEHTRIPTSEEINAGRKPGEATAWIAAGTDDLPRRSIKLHDLWLVGDTVVQAVHKRVTARRVSDGAEVWSVPLPAPVCETPVNPTPDGKVVLVYKSSQAVHGNRCNQLQMIDLRTGKAGWHKELTETRSMDDTIIVNSAISGDVLTVVQSMKAAAYRVADGAKLYDIPRENPGECYPDDVAGGPRLLVSYDCSISIDRSRNFSRLAEIVPRSGKVLWRYRTRPGWKIGKALSVDPVVLTTLHTEERTDNWRIVALGSGGKLRTTVDPGQKGFTYCAEAGESNENMQNCQGTLVDEQTVYLGGTDRVGAYDLGTGKLLWGVKTDGHRTLHPLSAEGGSRSLVYEAASVSQPGGIIRLGPGGVETKQQVLRHPATARAAEARMFAGHLAYVNGRIVITPGTVYGDDARPEARMLSFAPAAS
ncbi:PQQ-binding-like beta-propeller repeat protein [Streptomyces sp. RM99]|uniref:outer membrane protein assembly factor BamB family protein n=1 Tax=Streptomyces sp. RM99 TaxID=2824897 RepID=UPI001B3883CF|nr:PQQ-binding-like beta-propeller repeat protein [Streptomyces sp. RM99]MBQ0910323.1 PQQ-binding-like beta-propeller repeat protein [Streptomyces sp. RM99]